MSEAVTLTAETRTTKGSRAAGKLRKAGKMPAIVYGHKEEPISVTVNYEEFNRAIRVQHARVLDLKIGGKVEKVLIRELQWDHLGDFMIHADFERVSAEEKVKVVIPVKLKNSPKTMSGGVLDQPMHMIHIECSAISIPDDITIDILNLMLGSPIHIRELNLPAGVKVLDAPEMVVVQIKIPGAEVTALPMDAAANEPEVIKKEKKAADDDE
ncbi:MAG: 50S ribosomal protein L25 [Gemmataceae bacterium]